MNHRARKRFGQNFLQDHTIIERIVSSMRLKSDDNVVEVGPGLGALTLPLLAQLDKLHVIEIDRDLIQRLEAQQLENLTIQSADVLNVDLEPIAAGKPLRIVGNLPYNIGTPLLIRLLDVHHLLKDIHVMLQKEVVDRLDAKPNTRAFGRISVLMQSVFHIEPLFKVPPHSFEPAPKVESAVVRLIPLENALNKSDIKALENCTRIAFASKRKTLRNNLKGHLDDESLESLGINPQARAETLDVNAFHRLSKRLSET
ncbi:MAG: 16S rRNA (adenine1518-N6/adenine1519-N6)-dimethyltransferase [Porticoccaceae bacterium]